MAVSRMGENLQWPDKIEKHNVRVDNKQHVHWIAIFGMKSSHLVIYANLISCSKGCGKRAEQPKTISKGDEA